ncbi:MAG: enoyl-CoA hydratase family protein [Planctomycetes bacterium]|nr:enoyl-CoA hydratase family protein [Planctomycetota bacterium]
MKTPRSFLFEVRDGIATITLNRPERLNALTFEAYGELRDTFRALKDESDVRVVILTGKGKGFCSGGDVHDIIGPLLRKDAQGLLEFTRMTCDVVVAMRRLPKPIVARINGVAAGAGAILALASDLRIASHDSRFAFLFTQVGLSGADMGACFLLPRVIGTARAAELLMTSDKIDAAEALRIGLVNRVVPADQLDEETHKLARKLANGPAHGLEITKRCLNDEMSMNLEDAIDLEARVQAECMTHPDFREAYQAFVEKRAPRFK